MSDLVIVTHVSADGCHQEAPSGVQGLEQSSFRRESSGLLTA